MGQHAASVAWVALVSLGFVSQAALAQSVETAAYASSRNEQPYKFDVHQATRLAERALYYSPETWSQLRSWAARHRVTGLQGAAVAAAGTDTAVDRNSNPRFGFSDPRAVGTPQGWFYDYVAYSPTFYAKPNSDTPLYRTATRYYDWDNDGVYDGLSRFWDSDYNGSYDAHERVDFASFGDGNYHTDAADGPHGASPRTVNGTINATKIVAVNATGHLIVRITDVQSVAGAEIDMDILTAVDLGPAAPWVGQSVKVGEQMTATGVLELIGDKQVLIAETATVGSQKQMAIPRVAPRFEGHIVDVTALEVNGAQHTFAILESDSIGQIVDFGPADRLAFSLEPQATISVQGMPVCVYDHRLILADHVYWNGLEAAIQRW